MRRRRRGRSRLRGVIWVFCLSFGCIKGVCFLISALGLAFFWLSFCLSLMLSEASGIPFFSCLAWAVVMRLAGLCFCRTPLGTVLFK